MKNKKNAIENEMIANGSLLATMDVYKDFLFYESGTSPVHIPCSNNNK